MVNCVSVSVSFRSSLCQLLVYIVHFKNILKCNIRIAKSELRQDWDTDMRMQCSDSGSSKRIINTYVFCYALVAIRIVNTFLYYQPVHSAPSCYVPVAKCVRMCDRCNDIRTV